VSAGTLAFLPGSFGLLLRFAAVVTVVAVRLFRWDDV
jgi:hypothetical protein